LPKASEGIGKALVPNLISYATGTLLGAAFLGMIPAGLERAPALAVTSTVLVGIVLFFMLEKFVLWRHCHDDACEVRPFINIRDVETRHIQALCSLFISYDVPIPKNTWPGRVTQYKTLHEACEAGVTAEIENKQMYEKLLKMTDKEDILLVLGNLQEASQERHLAAFQRCVERRQP
jgi:hypothetical protein